LINTIVLSIILRIIKINISRNRPKLGKYNWQVSFKKLERYISVIAGSVLITLLKLSKIVKLNFMLAKAGIHYAKINEIMDSHFRGNDKSGFFFCYKRFA